MDNLNNISYADGWKDASVPVYKQQIEQPIIDDFPKTNVDKTKKKHYNKPIIIIIQLILCFIVLLTAFCLKIFGGSLYSDVRKWYYTNLNDEIFITDSFESLDLDKLFNYDN